MTFPCPGRETGSLIRSANHGWIGSAGPAGRRGRGVPEAYPGKGGGIQYLGETLIRVPVVKVPPLAISLSLEVAPGQIVFLSCSGLTLALLQQERWTNTDWQPTQLSIAAAS